MRDRKYLDIVKHYETCFMKFGDTPKGMDWPNEDDAFLRYEIMLQVIRETETVDLLDFGCGTSLLYKYLKEREKKGINYSGLDISKEFISLAKTKYPENTYYSLDILSDTNEVIPKFDYIICNGVFTEKRELSFEEMWEYFQIMLPQIFEKVKKGMAFNVMSKAVDWERWDLFHLPTDLLINFMTKHLSRNFIIRNDYGLYEYTVYLYK